MRRPNLNREPRDYTDKYLRRIARVLGFKGKFFPLAIADVLVHPNQPGDYAVLCHPGERRRDAAERLRKFADVNEIMQGDTNQ